MDFTVPPVHAVVHEVPCTARDGEHDAVLVIVVEPSQGVHANDRDEVFLRIGDENRRLGFRQRQELMFDKGQSSYEAQPVVTATMRDLDPALVAEYASRLRHPDAPRLLVARGLAVRDTPTVAGMLMFGAYPQQHFPQAYVRVLRYRGRYRGSGADHQLVRDVRCEGAIPTQIRLARDVVREVQPVRHALRSDGRFGDVPLVPEDAWLEGLVNAVVHRSYSNAGDHIRVDVFDDRIEVSSPGRFPGLVRLAAPEEAVRFARNPRVARVAAELEFGQEVGEGIRRMFREMRQAGLTDPLYEQTPASVRLTLSAALVERTLDAALADAARPVVAALRDAGRLGTSEVAEILGVSRPTAGKRLADLADAGLIEWVGRSKRDPRAYWRLPSR